MSAFFFLEIARHDPDIISVDIALGSRRRIDIYAVI